MLQQQQGVGSGGVLEPAPLQLPLPLPAHRKRHRIPGFKKNCGSVGDHAPAFLAWREPGARIPPGGRTRMKLLIHGRNLDVTPAIREYTETKLNRAISHFDGMVKEADVHLSVARNPRVPQQTAEVTVFANGTVIRAQERSENLYASIDLVASKLSRQLTRYKDRLQERSQGPVHRSAAAEEAGAASLPEPRQLPHRRPGARRAPPRRASQVLRHAADGAGGGPASAGADRPRLLRVPGCGHGPAAGGLPPQPRGLRRHPGP